MTFFANTNNDLYLDTVILTKVGMVATPAMDPQYPIVGWTRNESYPLSLGVTPVSIVFNGFNPVDRRPPDVLLFGLRRYAIYDDRAAMKTYTSVNGATAGQVFTMEADWVDAVVAEYQALIDG